MWIQISLYSVLSFIIFYLIGLYVERYIEYEEYDINKITEDFKKEK